MSSETSEEAKNGETDAATSCPTDDPKKEASESFKDPQERLKQKKKQQSPSEKEQETPTAPVGGTQFPPHPMMMPLHMIHGGPMAPYPMNPMMTMNPMAPYPQNPPVLMAGGMPPYPPQPQTEVAAAAASTTKPNQESAKNQKKASREDNKKSAQSNDDADLSAPDDDDGVKTRAAAKRTAKERPLPTPNEVKRMNLRKKQSETKESSPQNKTVTIHPHPPATGFVRPPLWQGAFYQMPPPQLLQPHMMQPGPRYIPFEVHQQVLMNVHSQQDNLLGRLQRLDTLQEQNNVLKREKDTVEKQLKKLRSREEKYLDNAKQQKKEIASLKKQNKQLAKDIEKLKTRLENKDEISKQNKQLAKEISKLKKQLGKQDENSEEVEQSSPRRRSPMRRKQTNNNDDEKNSQGQSKRHKAENEEKEPTDDDDEHIEEQDQQSPRRTPRKRKRKSTDDGEHPKRRSPRGKSYNREVVSNDGAYEEYTEIDSDMEKTNTQNDENDDENHKEGGNSSNKSEDGDGKKQENFYDKRWKDQLEKLKQFYAFHGHFNTEAHRDDEDWKDLHHWALDQRRQYKCRMENKPSYRHSLREERIAMLDEIGFTWSPENKFDKKWNDQFEKLKEYQRQHGKCHVSLQESRESKYKKELRRWIGFQRTQYKMYLENKQTSMTDERIDKLNGIGFAWRVSKSVFVDWNTRFQQLLAFKAQHGHCRVPQHRKKWCGNLNNLGEWVLHQRRLYRELKAGKISKANNLTEERIKLLESAGFEWSIRKRESSRIVWDGTTENDEDASETDDGGERTDGGEPNDEENQYYYAS